MDMPGRMISLTAQGIAEVAKGSQNQDKIEEEGEEEEEDGISDVAARGESSDQHHYNDGNRRSFECPCNIPMAYILYYI